MLASSKSFSDWFSLLGRRAPGSPAAGSVGAQATPHDPAYPTKALPRFVRLLQGRENPALLDLGPVVGSNVTFFGEQLGCRLRVEDLAADLERLAREGRVEELPSFLRSRFPQEPESIDGILCWDLFDFLDRPSAQALADALKALLKPDGVLLGFFGATEGRAQVYTKFVVLDENTLRYRSYPATRGRQKPLQNRDVDRMFEGLRVTESFLMKNNVREILLRKPAYLRPLP